MGPANCHNRMGGSPTVGLKLPHRFRFPRAAPFAVVAAPAHLLQRLQPVAAAVSRGCSRTTGILPLRLRRQTIATPFPILGGQPVTKRHRIVPGDAHHRVIVGLLESRFPPVCFGVHLESGVCPDTRTPFALGLGPVPSRFHKLCELAPGNLVHPHVETLRQVHAVLYLGSVAPLLSRRASHQETARRNQDKLHADRVGHF